MVTSPLAYPLHWPAEVPRARSRTRSLFKVSLARAVSDLQDSLDHFGTDTDMPVRDVVISSKVTLGAARPSNPGVAVYFEWDGAQRCIAIDRFARPEDNVRAIYTILEARRPYKRCGGLHIARAAFQCFSVLPPPHDWRAVLGVGPDADLAAVEGTWREKARAVHPDQRGGSGALMAELDAAREAARREMAS